jgi:AraC-like DNA-binding protein
LGRTHSFDPPRFSEQIHRGIVTVAMILRWRLERVVRLIRLERLSLADASFASGFFDQSHMTNATRRHFGASPAALLTL